MYDKLIIETLFTKNEFILFSIAVIIFHASGASVSISLAMYESICAPPDIGLCG